MLSIKFLAELLDNTFLNLVQQARFCLISPFSHLRGLLPSLKKIFELRGVLFLHLLGYFLDSVFAFKLEVNILIEVLSLHRESMEAINRLGEFKKDTKGSPCESLTIIPS